LRDTGAPRGSHSREGGNPRRKPLEMRRRRSGFPLPAFAGTSFAGMTSVSKGIPFRVTPLPRPGMPGQEIHLVSWCLSGDGSTPTGGKEKPPSHKVRCCPNLRRSAGFQPALSRQDGGATFKLGQHPKSQKVEDCSFRQVWRLTNLLIKVRNGALA
jgi:hypothetical protein